MSEDDTLAAEEQATALETDGAPSQEDAPGPTNDAGSEDAQVEPQAEASPAKPDPSALTSAQKPTEEAKAPGNTPPAAAKPAEPPVNPMVEKRLRDQQSFFSRQINEWQRKHQTLEQEATNLRKFKEEQDRHAASMQLPKYSARHPQHAEFKAVLDKAQIIEQQMAAIDPKLPPEVQEATRQALMSALGPEDRQTIEGYRKYQRDSIQRLATDPHGMIAEIAMPMMQQLLTDFVRKHQEDAAATAAVAKDFNDPAVKAAVEANPEEVESRLKAGSRYEDVIEITRLRAELEQAKSRASAGDKVKAHAEEQVRLAKGASAIVKDPRTPPTTDPYKAAKAKALREGVPLNSPRFMQLLAENT